MAERQPGGPAQPGPEAAGRDRLRLLCERRGGGPIKRNALWFYASYQDNGNQNIVANSFFRDGTPGTFDQRLTNRSARITWQASPRNKISGLVDDNDKMIDHEGRSDYVAGEADNGRIPRRKRILSVKWTSTVSNKLLFEAGALKSVPMRSESISRESCRSAARLSGTPAPRGRTSPCKSGQCRTADHCSIRKIIHRFISSGVTYRNVAGAHTLKAGGQFGFGELGENWYTTNANLNQRYRNGIPDSVVVHNTPTFSKNRLNSDLGFYVQDAWHVTDRLTLSPGLRFEYLKAQTVAVSLPAGRFVTGNSRHLRPPQLVRSGAEVRRGLRPDGRRKNRVERHHQ